MDSFLVGPMQETPQNITWFLFGIEQHEYESQPQQIKLSDAGPTFLCLKLLHFWANKNGPASLSVAQSPSRNTCLAILATPVCWPLGLEETPHPTAQLCPVHSCRGSAALQVQGRLFPHPMVSKHDYLSSLKSPSFCLDAWLLYQLSTWLQHHQTPSIISPPCVLLQGGWTPAHSLALQPLWPAHF